MREYDKEAVHQYMQNKQEERKRREKEEKLARARAQRERERRLLVNHILYYCLPFY